MAAWSFALCRTMLAEHLAQTALGNAEQTPGMFDARPAT
jgi:hypothetical protein